MSARPPGFCFSHVAGRHLPQNPTTNSVPRTLQPRHLLKNSTLLFHRTRNAENTPSLNLKGLGCLSGKVSRGLSKPADPLLAILSADVCHIYHGPRGTGSLCDSLSILVSPGQAGTEVQPFLSQPVRGGLRFWPNYSASSSCVRNHRSTVTERAKLRRCEVAGPGTKPVNGGGRTRTYSYQP